jgi:glutathione peroxidase-family protein
MQVTFIRAGKKNKQERDLSAALAEAELDFFVCEGLRWNVEPFLPLYTKIEKKKKDQERDEGLRCNVEPFLPLYTKIGKKKKDQERGEGLRWNIEPFLPLKNTFC